ncbi:DUF1330 domain-containing protein [uncultured Litoreibacter sp.]|uniref:DUF1330 domain-containing protein n=1 Tax=uncultured Litoreibacter sp. TaxID=1392394 RepID=UPI00262D7CB0|nr:DUF1330 domain-containing protein [uncultured Litoreibacter sp.]
MSALFISRVTVKDPAKFREYLQRSKNIASEHGAELLASGEGPRSLSGTAAPHQLAVVVRFPTMADLDAWHASPAYQDIIPLREAASDQDIIVYQMSG